jgi:hypothetical protein
MNQWLCGGANSAVNMAWNEVQIEKPLCDDARKTFQMQCDFLRLPSDICKDMDQLPKELFESARKAKTACKRAAQARNWHSRTQMGKKLFYCGT